MTKSVIECPWEVGDQLFLAPSNFDKVRSTSDEVIKAYVIDGYNGDPDKHAPVFPIIQLRVIGVRTHHFYLDDEDTMRCVPVTSALEDVYKVMRNRGNSLAVALLTMDMKEVVRLDWPESRPFHDAFGPIEDKFTQVMYVSALNVDGNYKLIEVLDDQDW